YYMLIISLIIAFLFLLIFQLFLFSFTLSAFLITCFLLLENINEWRHRFYVFIRFLLNRYKSENVNKQKSTLVIPANYTLMDVLSLCMQTKKNTIYVSLSTVGGSELSEYYCVCYYFYCLHFIY